MEVAVTVRNRRNGTARHITVDISDCPTVGHIGQKVSKACSVPVEDLKMVLCGRVLEQDTSVQSLLLGPTTSLLALVVEAELPSPSNSLSMTHSLATPSTDQLTPTRPQIGAFHVYCKGCKDIAKGKLRVQCGNCKSSEVIVKSEPSGWNDVIKSNRILVHCENCAREDAFARFYFKCVNCSEVSAALSQVRCNWESSPCVVCDETPKFVFDLGCNHAVCQDCFTQYSTHNLRNALFTFKIPFGYTVKCPQQNCDFCITDVHHFRILGEELYKEYQRIATEKLIALDETGVFCPYPDCGASFFWEEEDNREEEERTQCPECMRLFCKTCREHECKCHEDDETTSTIQSTTRKCPGCNVSTERNGGCAHMSCVHCHIQWCWVCGTEWREDCQWDHWFA